MNSKQNRKFERKMKKEINKFTSLLQSELDEWEKDPKITKEEIIRQLRKFEVL